MGLLKKMQRRAAAEDAALDAQGKKARYQAEMLSGVSVLDALVRGFTMMEEYRKRGEDDMVDFIARRIAASELFDSGGVRPSLMHARSSIMSIIAGTADEGGDACVLPALQAMGRSGRAPELASCCKAETNRLLDSLKN